MNERPADLEDASQLVKLLPWLMHNEPGSPDPLLEVAQFLVRPAWHARAACRGMGTRAFFPQLGETGTEARGVCAKCPVREQCLASAIAGEESGVWAGTTERERVKMRRVSRSAA